MIEFTRDGFDLPAYRTQYPDVNYLLRRRALEPRVVDEDAIVAALPIRVNEQFASILVEGHARGR